MKHALYTRRSGQRQQQRAGTRRHAHIPEKSVQPARHAMQQWKHLMIANQIQTASKTGFYWKVWENKWGFNCGMFVCGGWTEQGRFRQVSYGTLIGEIDLWPEYLFLNRLIFSLRVSAVDRKGRDGV